MTNDISPRLLFLVAHPDDAEFHGGGLAALHGQLDHAVKFVSLTNGDAGHHVHSGPPLAERRRSEATAAARLIGGAAEVWDHHDGRLEPTLDLRWQVVREIRTFAPDLVLTHRTNDYHPDHRAVGQVVRDASYLVTVPALVPDTPCLSRDPVVAYLPDRFTKPAPLVGDVVLDVGSRVETIVEMLACHRSQFFEWLPFNRGVSDEVPGDEARKRRWLRDWYLGLLRPQADRYRAELIARYGPQRGAAVEYAEVFEISEYGTALDDAARERFFPTEG
ncbi:MAG TPA: PIG-L deacetylase family protein [Pirellulales bacterium]|jgi:LmbE family N-acetylglucosaminyl deacetylase|nr:PIG-L deacetylase family protein [Pirellulales bacterium]